MTEWAIRVPHRARDERLVDVASHCRHLEGDERDVMREIVIEAMTGGMRTAGELLAYVGALEPGERRALLNQARAACDLPPTSEVEALERMEVASKSVRNDGGYQICHGRTADHLECNAVPMTDYGVPQRVNVNRWFCAAHRDQAKPGDMDPRPAPWRYSESGAIVPTDPVEQAREAAAAESRRRQREALMADRAAEAAAISEHRDAVADQHRRELPEHLRELA
jgi:hypothetical protein